DAAEEAGLAAEYGLALGAARLGLGEAEDAAQGEGGEVRVGAGVGDVAFTERALFGSAHQDEGAEELAPGDEREDEERASLASAGEAFGHGSVIGRWVGDVDGYAGLRRFLGEGADRKSVV